MDLQPPSAVEISPVIYRTECRANRSLERGSMFARRTAHGNAPTWRDFDNHLACVPRPTGLLSFTNNFRRALQRRELLERRGQRDIVVIAVWAKDLTGVYDAEEVASLLGYSDTGSDPCRKRRDHHDEYIIEGGILADEYRILAIFNGSGMQRDVVFECSLYKSSTTIPYGFFPGHRSPNALQDLGDEIHYRTGVRDDLKRDELVKSIMGRPYVFPTFLLPTIQYEQRRGNVGRTD
ncbi:hypothetical protein ASPCAL07439 [Aspergillus calidoustus]|uniref:DUF7587 domain-containing protein n=1 Tax=Aspergillus calidoustus TaxID=454130 RepID=A0A0U5G652_ASPCI|nr:hypothetical protein ASPCAL07439 [Aspergillus calidoustus]